MATLAFADHAPVPSYGPAPIPVYAPSEPAYPDVSIFSDKTLFYTDDLFKI